MTHETAVTSPTGRDRWLPVGIVAALLGPINMGVLFLYVAIFPDANRTLGEPVVLGVAVVEIAILAVLLKWRRALSVTALVLAFGIAIASTIGCFIVVFVIEVLVSAPQSTVDN